ncbi:MAG: hypothetical protein ACJ8ER_12385 [Allosphingosinicella sp.]
MNALGRRTVIAGAALALGLSACITTVAGPGDRRPDPADPLIRERQQLIEAHQRAARAGPPPPIMAPPPASGIISIPIDLDQVIRLDKEGQTRSVAEPAPGGTDTAARGASGIVPPLPPPCPTSLGFAGPTVPMKTYSLVKVFPGLQWHICLTDMARKGLWIGPVELRRGSSGPWMQVLAQAGLAEIFVPYHVEPLARWYDLNGPQRLLSPITAEDLGPDGYPITLTNESFPTVAAEVRTRGVGWMCKGTTYQTTRRSEELALWAVTDAGNYDNIVEYAFRDDGAITFRLGNSGYNSPPRPAEPHTHNALWYIDMDLNGNWYDSASMLTHHEAASPTPLDAQDVATPFQVEGARKWDPEHLGSLLIEDKAVNRFGQHLGYEFSPLQNALTRHYGGIEKWTLNDIYITRWRMQDLLWANPYVGPTLPEIYATLAVPDEYLLPALDKQAAVQTDLVAWIKTATHHHPTDEDRTVFNFFNTGTAWGVTGTHWSGFKIEPHNIFDFNPQGAPLRCDPPSP